MDIYTTKSQVEQELVQIVKTSGVFKNTVFTPLSRVYTFIRAVANAIYLFIDVRIIDLQKSIHPHTSGEEGLLDWLYRYRLTWKPAIPARHKIRIGSTVQPAIDTEIPQGQIVTTQGSDIEKISFSLVNSIILPKLTPNDDRDYYTIEAEVEALDVGTTGNVAEDTITGLDSPPPGIDVVYNTSRIVDGEERESIASVRERLYAIERGITQMWTPDWYESESKNFTSVWRSIYVTAKELGIPGLSELFITGATSELSDTLINQLYEYFNNDIDRNSGSGEVLVKNIPRVNIEKTFTIRFSESSQVPSQSELDTVKEDYFFQLNLGQSFIDDQLKSNFFNFPGVVEVTMFPQGDVIVAAQELAVPNSNFQIIGEVYS
jgi:uncharacterized phage protein gp47/JayE